MTREEMIAELNNEIERLERVRSLLQESNDKKIDLSGSTLRGAAAQVARAAKADAESEQPRRMLSPEARRRIALAQKRRWARQKSTRG